MGIAADDRPALERLLRYCARPCWASERLTQADDGERLIYTFDKPRPDGSWQLTLTPLELLDRLARFIPPPRRHLHRYHGVFAPHAALRAQVAARAGEAIAAPVASTVPESVASVSATAMPVASATPENLAAAIRAQLGLPANIRPLPEPSTAASPGARSWARLIARIYEVDPLRCRRCGGSMQLIAFMTERSVIARILDHLGELKPRAADGSDPRPAWRRQHDATGRSLDRQIAPPRSSSRRHARLREPEPGNGLVTPSPATRDAMSGASTPTHAREMEKTPSGARVNASPGARGRQARSRPQNIALEGLRGPLAGPLTARVRTLDGTSPQRTLREKWLWNSYPYLRLVIPAPD